MELLSTSEMKLAEKYAIDNIGVPSIVLMENAAKNAADVILNEEPKSVVVFAGKGNNGGDGLAIARHLISHNIETKIIFIGNEDKATADCKTNLNILKNYKADIEYGFNSTDISQYDIVVDALIGTGLSRKLSDEYIEIVEFINNSRKKTIAVDCPTGINSDTGEDYGIAVNADITVTFHRPKIGLMLYPAYSHCGKIVVKDIGIPYIKGSKTFVLDSINMPERKKNSHKGTYGKALIVGGCDTMAGAAILNAKAAYKIGAGLVNICSTPHVINVAHCSIPEATTTPRSKIDYNYGNVCAIGSGLGINYEIVKNTIENCNNTLVIDADGLNSIANNTDILFKLRTNCVITPHIMEMSRLTGKSVTNIKNNMVSTALDFAKKYNVVVLLKDSHSVIANPKGDVCINITGTPAMSKGGTGDCLCGVITGLIAQGVDAFEAACMGAYINGKAGEAAEKRLSAYGVMASDVVESISEVLLEIS